MRYNYSILIAISLVLVAMVVAGCTSSSPNAPTAAPTQGTAATTSATTTTTATSNAGKLPSLYQDGKFKTYEYKITSGLGNFDSKYTYDTASYGGVANARHVKYEMGSSGAMSTYDLYYDGTKFLGGTHTMPGGTPKDLGTSGWGGGQVDNAIEVAGMGAYTAITNAGSESVTVPAGTYNCTKYTSTGDEYAGTYWVTPDVPVPVKMVLNDKDLGTFELESWS